MIPFRSPHLRAQVFDDAGVCISEKHSESDNIGNGEPVPEMDHNGESDNIGNSEPVQEMDHNIDHPDRCIQVNMTLGSSSIGVHICRPIYPSELLYAHLLLGLASDSNIALLSYMFQL
jgi:hypothetical protein